MAHCCPMMVCVSETLLRKHGEPVALLSLLLKQLPVIGHYFFFNFGLYHASNGHALPDAMANVGAVERIEWGVGKCDMGRQCVGGDNVMWSWIHHDGVAA